MLAKPAKPEAYRLLHEGSLELARVEQNGIRIDTDYLRDAIALTREQIADIESELSASNIFKQWRRRYHDRANLGSRQQLGVVIFDVVGLERKEGVNNNDEEAYSHLVDKEPFLAKYFKLEKLKKIHATYLTGILRETVDGRIHPVFNLHTARTYRSSSDSPNFQNFPIRVDWIAKIIRQCFVADSADYCLVENDFGGHEVRIAACYNKDPKLVEYLTGGGDMHLDAACDSFMMKPEDFADDGSKKMARYSNKNMFVFPEFYGSFYKQCAPNLWEAIDKFKLRHKNGYSIKKHLRKKGIKELGECRFGTKEDRAEPEDGTFEKHIQKCERKLWERLKVYAAWKRSWYEKYLRTGGFTTLTGFRVEGIYAKNDVINYPVQGSAFHCLLRTLILLNRWLRKKKMKSYICGQIHDSIISCVHRKELQDFINMVKHIATVEVPNEWKWISVPLEIEAEVCPFGGNWFEKKKWDLKNGLWQLAS